MCLCIYILYIYMYIIYIHLPVSFPVRDALKVCGGFWGERLCRPVISVLMPPGFH